MSTTDLDLFHAPSHWRTTGDGKSRDRAITPAARHSVARTFPAGDPQPTVYRLSNPWTFHLVAACAVAALTLVGGFAAAVLDSGRLDLVAAAVLTSLALVVGLSVLHGRFEANPPQSAFVPVDPA